MFNSLNTLLNKLLIKLVILRNFNFKKLLLWFWLKSNYIKQKNKQLFYKINRIDKYISIIKST